MYVDRDCFWWSSEGEMKIKMKVMEQIQHPFNLTHINREIAQSMWKHTLYFKGLLNYTIHGLFLDTTSYFGWNEVHMVYYITHIPHTSTSSHYTFCLFLVTYIPPYNYVYYIIHMLYYNQKNVLCNNIMFSLYRYNYKALQPKMFIRPKGLKSDLWRSHVSTVGHSQCSGQS